MSSNLLTLRSLSPDERRRAADTHARVRFMRARRAIGLTQLGLSQWLGCSRDAVETWESGKRRVPAWALVAIESKANAKTQCNADGAACSETTCSELKPVCSRHAGPPVQLRRAA